LFERNTPTERHEQEFVKILSETSASKQDETLKSHKKLIMKNERRIAELDRLFGSLYEDKVSGEISQERFRQMSSSFEQEQTQLSGQIESLRAAHCRGKAS
jgi:hypothetical protein